MALGQGTAWGKESLWEYNGLVLNDRRVYDTFLIDRMDGLRSTDIRETREPNPSDDGEQMVGQSLLGGKTVTLTGRIRARNVLTMRTMQEQLRQAFQTRVELPLKIYSDPLYVHQNLAPNPRFRNASGTVDGTGWQNTQSASGAIGVVSAPAAMPDDPSEFGWRIAWTNPNDTTSRRVGVIMPTLSQASVVGSKQYAIMGDAYFVNPGTTTTLYVYWYKSSGVASDIASTSTVRSMSSGSTPAGSRQRLFGIVTAPSDAQFARVEGRVTSNAANDVVDVYWTRFGFTPTPRGEDPGFLDADSPGFNWYGDDFASPATAMVPVQLNCKPMSDVAMDEDQPNLLIERDFQIVLRASNPRVVKQAETVQDFPVTAGQTTVTGVVYNSGSFPAQARIRVTGPTGTNPKVENLTTGESIQFLGTWAAGKWIEAKTEGRRIYDDTGATKRSAMSGLSKWITLAPGANQIRLTLAAGAVSPVKVTVGHRDTWR